MRRERPSPPDREAAEALALGALAFIAEDARRLTRFLDLTGLSPSDIPAQVREPAFLASLLAHLLEDETQLLAFAANAGLDPARVSAAHALLAGTPPWSG